MPLCQSLSMLAAATGRVVTHREVSLRGMMTLFQGKTGITVTQIKKNVRFGAGNVRMTCIKQTTQLKQVAVFSAAAICRHARIEKKKK